MKDTLCLQWNATLAGVHRRFVIDAPGSSRAHLPGRRAAWMLAAAGRSGVEEGFNLAAYRILAMDGGGIRGLLTAVLIQRLESDVGKGGFLKSVHLFAGTSTGGIL